MPLISDIKLLFGIKAGFNLVLSYLAVVPGNKYYQAKNKHLRLGRRGESLACSLLRLKNYDILCRNYKVKSGEIDIVARDGHTLVFLEVKTRRHTTRSRPAQGLTEKQKKRILRAGMKYLKQIDNPEVIYRFDLIEMVVSSWKVYEARHWTDHFKSTTIYRNLR
jgi:putative endonuclease